MVFDGEKEIEGARSRVFSFEGFEGVAFVLSYSFEE